MRKGRSRRPAAMPAVVPVPLMALLPALLLAALLAGCGEGAPPDQVSPAAAPLDDAADTVPTAPPAPAPTHTDEGELTAGELVRVALQEWRIGVDRQTVPAGTISFLAENRGTRSHAVHIVDEDGNTWRTPPIRPGTSVQLSMILDPGEYTIACPLSDDDGAHADRGMQATIVVE